MNYSYEPAPFVTAMAEFEAKRLAPLHTPGHKQGQGAHSLLTEIITETGLKRDVSVADALDDLAEPTHCLKKAQELVAHLYGAKAAYFSVNGTTGALHIMLMAALNPGDKVLVARNIHRAVLGALVLVGANPVFIQPTVDSEFGIAGSLSVDAVAKAVKANPMAKGLVVTSPTYYGETADLAAIGRLLHEHDMLLMVDEAHGAHLAFSPKLPPDAITSGADLAAQSTHKLLGALTQCSWLLAGSNRVTAERLRKANMLLCTTSPNNLLLASLDIARLQMEECGEELVGRAVNLALDLRDKIDGTNGLKVFRPTQGDITKITVSVRELGISGFTAAEILRSEYKIEPELADAYNILFLLTYADDGKICDKIYTSLKDMAAKYYPAHKFTLETDVPPPASQRMSLRDAFFAPAVPCRIEEAVGRIAAEQIMFYPPGIPVIFPGEEITRAAVDFLCVGLHDGGKIVGAADLSLKTLRVVDDNS